MNNELGLFSNFLAVSRKKQRRRRSNATPWIELTRLTKENFRAREEYKSISEQFVTWQSRNNVC